MRLGDVVKGLALGLVLDWRWAVLQLDLQT